MQKEIINVRLSDDGTAVVILDQTLLPNKTKYIELRTVSEMYDAITSLRVRGAPAIGIFAAYALYVVARNLQADSYEAFRSEIMKSSALLSFSRPTAVNLVKQLRRVERLVESLAGEPLSQIVDAMRKEAESIRDEDVEMCRAISEFGLELIRDGFGILTYCNAGPIATSRYGTGLGPIFLAHERGWDLNVFCCETRPLLQGARLTTYELSKAGIECTLICDNMVSSVMSHGMIDAVFVGCDRVARNGDVANKIGTSSLAIQAKHYSIPLYVFCPSSTFDPDCMTGEDIEIEHRNPGEIKELYFSKPISPAGVKCYNPAFDITDHRLVTAIITEKGVCKPPYIESLACLVN